MSYEIKADYLQQYIFPPNLEYLVPSGHPARFIRTFVDFLDLNEIGFRVSKGFDGRPHYSSNMLLKIWLFGFFQKIRSTRDLERMCYNDLGAIWLTGMHYPDHNTLSRFFRNNKKALKSLFKEVTQAALTSGLTGFALHALDGTKIQARVSTRTGWNKKKLRKYLEGLDSSIDEIMEKINSSCEGEDEGYSMPEELHDKTKLKEKVEELLDKMDVTGRKHIHLDDKDARMMKNGKVNDYGYNAQAVVDGESNMIVAEDVTNDETDNNMLVPMIEKVEENLGDKADETVADGGYYSPKQLINAEEKGVDVLVNISEQISPTKGEKKFHKSKFVYDSKKDVVICPLGRELTFERVKQEPHKKYEVRLYRCHHKRDCPEKENCFKEKRGRSIEIGPHHEVLQRQIRKQKDPGNKEILAKRKQIVEPVFGIIKEIMGFRRFTVRGLENVKTQWSLVCTAFNLRKLFKVWVEGKLVMA